MAPMRATPRPFALLAAALALPACGDAAITSFPPPPRDLGTVDSIMSNLPQSCAFACDAECPEPAAPFVCPTLAEWDALPHSVDCPAWDGTFPTPTEGSCTVSDPTGAAARKAGPQPDGSFVLPDGHAIRPAGREVLFDDADLEGGFPMSLFPMPGTRFALSSDGGIYDNVLRLIDIDALAGSGDPVRAQVVFQRPSSLFYGVAWLAPDRVLASGGGDATIYAFDVDTAAGTLTRNADRDMPLGPSSDGVWYAGPIAATGDSARLVVAPSDWVEDIQIRSLGTGDYGALLATVDVGSSAIYDLRLDPFDPAGTTVWASDQANSRVLAVDAAAGKATRSIALGRNPSQIVFLDATWMVVAEANGDALAVVDRVAGTVGAHVPVFEADAPRGFSPTALAFDAASGRLYATLAGVNAVEVYDVGAGSPPTITPVGRIPTAWWPTAVLVDEADGGLVVLDGKGHGTGADAQFYTFSQGPITERMRGSIQHVGPAELADLAALSSTVDATRELADAEGHPVVSCPGGSSDFPVPSDNESGPSPVIKHVIFVVRENKTFDAVFGDRPDLGDGDPSLIMSGDPQKQAAIWQNARALASQFTNFDNFYTDAEQSIQGHTWTVYGRTNDFVERTWLTAWGRSTRPPTTPATSLPARPEEEGIFVWLTKNEVDNDDMGEIVNPGPKGFDTAYPGLVYAQNVPDIDKSCYIGGRIRLLCDLAPFTYAVQANDHTYGAEAGAAAPEVMVAVNDEAIGMLVDALSHSPIWKDSLVVVTEDDPQDGGDHVDVHRSILFMASPWMRRGYVSHGHYDVASIHKLFAHVFGIPYNNEQMRQAMLPLDAFTSTPDFTPFEYLPRTIAAPCNPSDTKEAKLAGRWEWDDVDDQPGLSEQVARLMKDPAARGVQIERRLAEPGTRERLKASQARRAR